jgi:tetratricopeptide (TPR) repeat protein
LGLVDEMITEFKHLLSLNPSNVNVKNALGYTLVDVNRELEYASQLIEQAYTAMPNNAAVIDSKGWLAYRNGAFDQAIQYLNLAFKISPSADVAVHIGEVYWQKGEKDKAKNFWNKAKQMDEKNHLLATTIKKFGVSLSN